MNIRDPQALLEKLKALPPERVAAVEDFATFCAREVGTRDAAAERLAQAMEKLSALDLPSMIESEVQTEIGAARHTAHCRTPETIET